MVAPGGTRTPFVRPRPAVEVPPDDKISAVKLILALVASAALLAVAAVLLEQRVEGDRQYRDLLASGDEHLASGDTATAIEAFSGALALRPSSMVAHLRRGEAYRADRRMEEAVRDLLDAARLAPDSTAPALSLGDLYDAERDWPRAADWYGHAASRLQTPALLYRLALARYRSGAPAAAIDPLERIVARDDTAGDAYYLLGLADRDARRPEEAVKALEHAVKIAPSLLPAREELADLYRTQGRAVDEMAQLQSLAALDVRPARIVAIAMAETRTGQLDASIATLSEVARTDPADPAVALAVSRVFLTRAERTLDRPSAMRALAVLSSAPADGLATSERVALLGRAQYLAGDWSRAERTLTEAVRTAPVDLEAFGFLADAAERLGHDADARDALANLDALQGDTASASARASRARRMGTISLRLGDAASAARSFVQATDLGAVDASTLALLAQAQWQAGDRTGARAALTRAVTADARNPDVARVARLVK
jgi:tetratricopeptide (TPR) repeat protein